MVEHRYKLKHLPCESFLYRNQKSKNSRSLKTKTNVRLADLKVPDIRVWWNWQTRQTQDLVPLCVRVQVSSPGPLYPAWRLGEEKPVSIPSWVFVQATTLNKQPAGSSLLLAKLLCSACRLVSTGSRVRSPGTITLRKVGYTVTKKRQPGRNIGNPSHLLKYLGPQLIWESACLASRRWRVRVSLGPP